MKKAGVILSVLLLFCGIAVIKAQQQQDEHKNPYYSHTDKNKLTVADAQWKKVLSPMAYTILREKGTEIPYKGPYVHNEKKGIYYCAACGNALFSSSTKFDSHTGWPSFYEPISKTAILQSADNSIGMERTEISCARCGGHLGHVFDDGPQPTGLRYCMNGFALNFEASK